MSRRPTVMGFGLLCSGPDGRGEPICRRIPTRTRMPKPGRAFGTPICSKCAKGQDTRPIEEGFI